MIRPRCLCCKNWNNAYQNAVCNACRNGDKWEAKGSCKGADGVMRCDSCKHSSEPKPKRIELRLPMSCATCGEDPINGPCPPDCLPRFNHWIPKANMPGERTRTDGDNL